MMSVRLLLVMMMIWPAVCGAQVRDFFVQSRVGTSGNLTTIKVPGGNGKVWVLDASGNLIPATLGTGLTLSSGTLNVSVGDPLVELGNDGGGNGLIRVWDDDAGDWISFRAGPGRFVFPDVQADTFLGSGSGLTNLNAGNVTAGTLAAARLPLPTATTLGGVMRNAGTSGQFVTGINASGQLTFETPAGGTGTITGTPGNANVLVRSAGGTAIKGSLASLSDQGLLQLTGTGNGYGFSATRPAPEIGARNSVRLSHLGLEFGWLTEDEESTVGTLQAPLTRPDGDNYTWTLPARTGTVMLENGDGGSLTGITPGQVGAVDANSIFFALDHVGYFGRLRLRDDAADGWLDLTAGDSSLTVGGDLYAANLSGTNTGDQTSVTGNAGTATRLETARTINGVSFDGTAPITVTVPVSTGVTGLGTGVGTALGVNVGTAGSVVVNGGALGTPASGTLTNATGLPLTTGVTGVLPVANGGTGLTSAGTAGHVMTSTGTGFVMAAPSGGGSGTVTSVAGTGTVNGLTLTGTVTSSGSLTLGGTLSGVNLATAVTVPGSGSELLFRSSGTEVGVVTGSSVSSGAVTLGGVLSATEVRLAAENSGLFLRAAGSLGIRANGNQMVDIRNNQIHFGTNFLHWSSAMNAAVDLGIGRDAADTLAQRRSTNAQQFRISNTWTSLTNNETFTIDWRTTANLCRVGTEKGSGGGTARAMSFVTDGTVRMTIDALGRLIPVLPTSAAGLPSGALWNDAGTVKVAP